MTAKAVRNRRSKTSVSLTLAAVTAQATGTPSPSVPMWYLVPRLLRSVGLGPVRSPPRLARTEQVSRIRSGWPRSMLTSSTCTFASTAVSAQRARQRRRVEPLACSSVAVRLRQGVPSRRKRRSVVTTRIVSVGGWPGPRSAGRSQASITVAMRCRSLKSNAVVPVCWHRYGKPQRGTADQGKSTLGSCENHLLGVAQRARETLGWKPAIPWEQTLDVVLRDWRNKIQER